MAVFKFLLFISPFIFTWIADCVPASSNHSMSNSFSPRAIINGKQSEHYPFFVEVLIEITKDLLVGADAVIKCGGTILYPKVILTAAHCLYLRENVKKLRWVEKSEVSVVKGDFTKFSWEKTQRKYKCSSYKRHELYDTNLQRGYHRNDIALIYLKEKIPLYNQDSASLGPCQTDGNYEIGTIMGLGIIHENPRLQAGVLMEIDLHADPQCTGSGISFNVDQTLQLCFSDPNNGEKSTCFGDSGGPLVAKNHGKVECVFGISSAFTAKTCTTYPTPNVFTKVFAYLDWIKKHTKGYKK